MTMQYDVRSAQLDQDESVSGRSRLKGLLITSAANGVIAISDGASGNTLFGFNAVTAGNVFIPVPGEGILFETAIYAKTVTNAKITAFYG